MLLADTNRSGTIPQKTSTPAANTDPGAREQSITKESPSTESPLELVVTARQNVSTGVAVAVGVHAERLPSDRDF